MKTAFAVTIAMIAFAANSLFARFALADGDADALGYTGIRLTAGAAMLGLLVLLQRRSTPAPRTMGSWSGAAALFAYALLFSIAYLKIGAAAGALILFASVQAVMLAAALRQRERPGPWKWAGFTIAMAGVVLLLSDRLGAPGLVGSFMMMGAGAAWAIYSLIGRTSRAPIADTAGNFLRCAPFAMAITAIGVASHPPSLAGALSAIASGALASGLGYAIWYRALPGLSSANAALVQLTVPAIAAVAGVVLLQESLTARLVLASITIIGGIALGLAVRSSRHAAGRP